MFKGSGFSKGVGRVEGEANNRQAGLEWLEERQLLATVNLAPWQPAGWSDKIVVNRQAGVYTDSNPLYSNDTLYVNWAEINNGAAPTTDTFYTDLYVDDTLATYWYTTWPFLAGQTTNPTSYSIGSLSAGQHTIRVVVDSTDTVPETNELDNSYTKTITVVPVVTDVSSTASDGAYKAGALVPITVTFSGVVTVSTAHGTPRLALNDQGTALYAGGSGTDTLTFNYTVAAGQNAADLDYALTTSLTLNGGVIEDAFGNPVKLTLASPGASGSLGANKNIVIDTAVPAAPVVTGVTADTGSSASDAITTDQTLMINGTAEANSTVTVSRADVGVLGTCTANASKAWSFDYTGTILPEGSYGFTATATDPAGNTGGSSATRTVTVDLTGAAVSSVSANKSNGSYKAWAVIPVTVLFNENVTVNIAGGVPTLALNNGVTIYYTSGSGGAVLVFNYTVAAGDNSLGLDYAATSSLALNGGSIRDLAGNVVDLTLPPPGAAGSLSANKTLVIDTSAPSAPVFTGIDSDTGFDSHDGITGDATLVLQGTAEAGATVTVTRVGAGVIGACTADGGGLWAFDYTATVLPVGGYSFTAIATDAAGNVSGASAPYAVTISPAPAVTITPVSPDPRHAGVDSIAIVFNEAVLGFGLEDLTLTRNGGANLLGAPQTPTSGDGIHWTLGDLSGLTGLAGDYVLTLTALGAGITDSAGNPLADGASEDWHTNAAPALAGANDPAGINEDAAGNTGTLVSALISGQVTDADAGDGAGIAVTAADNTHGAWQYTTDGGSTWTALGSPSASAARLLAADASTRIRFVPAANWHGAVPAGISFRAWDRTSGAAGSTADVSANGGLTAYSSDPASVGITVAAVNDKPAGVAQARALDMGATSVLTLSATDVETIDLSAFAFNVPLTTVAGGTLTSLGSRQYQYAAPAGFVGADYFTYTVTDDGDPAGTHGAPGDLTSDPTRVDLQVGSQFALPVSGKGQYVDANGDLVSLTVTGAACTLLFPTSGLASLAAVHAD
ncbi:MAG: Ig-like domain-containing protein, partial [Planctomycetota bacterium]|nr:Ig-like domain-containing protein [Planctomycetota bacterium]